MSVLVVRKFPKNDRKDSVKVFYEKIGDLDFPGYLLQNNNALLYHVLTLIV